MVPTSVLSLSAAATKIVRQMDSVATVFAFQKGIAGPPRIAAAETIAPAWALVGIVFRVVASKITVVHSAVITTARLEKIVNLVLPIVVSVKVAPRVAVVRTSWRKRNALCLLHV